MLSHRAFDGFLLLVLDQVLQDLHGVAGGALADLITAAPEGQALVVGQVLANAAYPDQVLVAGVQGVG